MNIDKLITAAVTLAVLAARYTVQKNYSVYHREPQH